MTPIDPGETPFNTIPVEPALTGPVDTPAEPDALAEALDALSGLANPVEGISLSVVVAKAQQVLRKHGR